MVVVSGEAGGDMEVGCLGGAGSQRRVAPADGGGHIADDG